MIKKIQNADVPVVLESLRHGKHGRRSWDFLAISTEEEYSLFKIKCILLIQCFIETEYKKYFMFYVNICQTIKTKNCKIQCINF